MDWHATANSLRCSAGFGIRIMGIKETLGSFGQSTLDGLVGENDGRWMGDRGVIDFQMLEAVKVGLLGFRGGFSIFGGYVL